jgi:hypothetical protein
MLHLTCQRKTISKLQEIDIDFKNEQRNKTMETGYKLSV